MPKEELEGRLSVENGQKTVAMLHTTARENVTMWSEKLTERLTCSQVFNTHSHLRSSQKSVT